MGTIRQDLIKFLKSGHFTAKEISKQLRVSEKEISTHLSHIARTVASKNCRLTFSHCECLSCGYSFSNRNRFTTPGKCPKCKHTRISPPVFHIE